MKTIMRIADKAGVLGAVVSAMGCATGNGAAAFWAWSGPAMVLVGVVWLLGTALMRPLVYTGIALMAAVSIWDLASPANRRCRPEGCEPPTKPNESAIP